MKHVSIYLLLLCLIACIGGCTKSDVDKKKNNNGFFDVSINGSLNNSFRAEGNCSKVFASYYPITSGSQTEHSLLIQGKNGNELISLIVYFQNLPTSAIPLDENVSGGPWGVGN